MKSESLLLETLERRIPAIAGAATPSEVFRLLLEGTGVGAPRAAVLLSRHGQLKGWASNGHPADAARRLRTVTLDPRESWLRRAVDPDSPEIVPRPEEERSPDFGQAPADQAVALPVRVGGRTVAVIVAERSPDESPWLPTVLAALVSVARIRLELDLAWRKLRTRATPRPAPETPAAETSAGAENRAAEEPPPRESKAPGSPEGPAPSEPPQESALAPAPEPRPRGPEDARREEARTYARLVATDIRLYNEEAVMLGRRNGDLARRLEQHLDRGRESFRQRFPELGDAGLAILNEAYTQVLAAGDPSLLSSSIPSGPATSPAE